MRGSGIIDNSARHTCARAAHNYSDFCIIMHWGGIKKMPSLFARARESDYVFRTIVDKLKFSFGIENLHIFPTSRNQLLN